MDGPARPVLRLAVAALVVALVPLSASSASAARLTVADARGDMIKVEEGGSDPRPAPGATIGDALRTTFRHTDHRVVVRVRFAELAPTGKRFNVWVELRDENGRTTIVGVEATPADRAGHPILMTNRGRDIVCAVDHRISYRRDFVRVSVPRRCLGHPESMKFRVNTEHVRRSWAFAYLDNALSRNFDDRSWTRPLRRG